MAGLPTHIFVVRHGNRLDAADKRWHLSSPTPYDPPLTYGGFLQSRQIGHQIASYLDQAKKDAEKLGANSARSQPKRKRFKIMIHSSPFLRCVQTSVGISSGLAQGLPDSSFSPSNLIASAPKPPGKPPGFRAATLRLDPVLGEWLTPEYFENITPPPGSHFMLSAAKADLLKREDYSIYTDFAPSATTAQPAQSSSLWNGSPTTGSGAKSGSPRFNEGSFNSPSTQSEEMQGYRAPRPTYAISSTGKIPDGFVAHARDECVTVDYLWDSMRSPLDFGDGGVLGEEWAAMHKRFRKGIKKMLNWYATADDPTNIDSLPGNKQKAEISGPEPDEDVDTVVIVVSHGAGCNALMGAITHQPVLMDVPIASITMATRKPDINYDELLVAAPVKDSAEVALVHVNQMYEIRLSASTEHLQVANSTPSSSRSVSISNVWAGGNGSRGRTPTLGTTMPALGPFTYSNDPLSLARSRSTSISGTLETTRRRDSRSRAIPRAMASVGISSGPGSGNTGGPRTQSPTAGTGLWAPTPSSLRLMDDGNGDSDKDDLSRGMPVFDQNRFKAREVETKAPSTKTPTKGPEAKVSKGPWFAAPIKLQTRWETEIITEPEEPAIAQLGDGLGGLWNQPRPPGEAEKNRDTTTSKRRWTVNER